MNSWSFLALLVVFCVILPRTEAGDEEWKRLKDEGAKLIKDKKCRGEPVDFTKFMRLVIKCYLHDPKTGEDEDMYLCGMKCLNEEIGWLDKEGKPANIKSVSDLKTHEEKMFSEKAAKAVFDEILKEDCLSKFPADGSPKCKDYLPGFLCMMDARMKACAG